MVDEGNVVPLLGSHLNRVGDEVRESATSGRPPDSVDLAAALARQAGMAGPSTHLAQVAQYVYETQGRADLYRPLTRLCGDECDPGPVHRFLADLPQRLERAGFEPRYQLIVSTNFDTALERAFNEAHEPYDLAVYMASGEERGKFIHFPYDDVAPKIISSPNAYAAFPIDEYGELARTVIVKIHGAVDGSLGEFRWRENYVITEDHYIDYLSRSPVESLVPIQILDKLRESHCPVSRVHDPRLVAARVPQADLGPPADGCEVVGCRARGRHPRTRVLDPLQRRRLLRRARRLP